MKSLEKLGKFVVVLFIFMVLLLHVASCNKDAVSIAQIEFQDKEPEFSYDRFLHEGEPRSTIVKIVEDYITQNTSSNGALVLEGKETRRRRKFKVVEVFDVVSIKTTYTVQVDVDEKGGDPKHLLYFDVIESGGEYILTQVRYGGRHMRQKIINAASQPR